MNNNKEWFKKHIKELKEKYKGKLVSVLDGEIIAVGNDLDEIREIIMAKRKKGEIHGIPFTGKADNDIAVIHLPPTVI